MLNMLPKFELVPISRYFIMLPDARRPSRIPRCRTRRLACPRMTSAASRATSAAVITEMPTSAVCSDGRVVDAVAHESDDVAPALERQDDPVLLSRRDTREHRRLLREVTERRVVDAFDLLPRDDLLVVQSDALAHVPRDRARYRR